MAEFPDVLDISTMDAATGQTVYGAIANSRLGSAFAAGDINGDGIGDLIVGANSENFEGAVYVVFGVAGGAPFNIDLSMLTGANGFKVTGGSNANPSFGYRVSTSDLNNDGYDDLLIGAYSDGPGNAPGSVTVLYGKAGPFDALVDVSVAVAGVSSIMTGADGDRLGLRVSGIGDFNGDGFGDFVVGVPFANRDGYTGNGGAYVIYGAEGGLPVNFSVGDIDGTNGFQINAPFGNDPNWAQLGAEVVGLGDMNNDGFDDFMITGPDEDLGGIRPTTDSGIGHIFLGRAAPSPDPTAVVYDNIGLFGPDRSHTGDGAAAAGDFNGDGYTDAIITQPGLSRIFIVFGSASPPVSYGLGGASPPAGTFAIVAPSNAQVFDSGDFNGDGFDDLLIGNGQGYSGSGVLYVVYGGATLSGQMTLDDLVPSRGFRIEGAPAGTSFASAARSIGDINGDGSDEIIIGAYGSDVNGANTGAFTIIWGLPGPVEFTGGAGDDVEEGGDFDDVLSGMGGRDRLSGLLGDDQLNGGDQGDTLLGGDGADTLDGGTGGDVLYGDDGDDTINGGADGDKLFGGLGADSLNGGVGNDRFDGGDGIDTLNGGDGADYLDGGADADAMAGGLGNDVYIVGAGDTVTEAANEGYDIVRTAEDGWILSDNVEGLELQGGADLDGYGNGGINNLQGNSGANRLDGGAGVDTINGNDGDDIVVGGLGNDLLRGGLGADVFAIEHAPTGSLETDQIYDFSAAEGDILDLTGVYAGVLTVTSSFGKQAGEMTLAFAGGVTTVKLDLNGDGRADYQARINGDVTDAYGDWLL